MLAVIQEEAQWRRVVNFVVFLHTGQHNLVEYVYCQLIGIVFSQAAYHRPIGVFAGWVAVVRCLLRTAPLSGVTQRSRPKSKVFENRDLCRIVGLYLVAINGGK